MLLKKSIRPGLFVLWSIEMWDDLWAALALMLVFEGIMPFLSPNRWRSMIEVINEVSDSTIRVVGLIVMLTGVVTLYIVRGIG